MSDQREQLNEMKKFRQLMEDTDAEELRTTGEAECPYCDDEEPLNEPCLNCGSKQWIGEVTGDEFIDDFESKLADNNPCMYCDGEDDNCEVCHGQDEMFEVGDTSFDDYGATPVYEGPGDDTEWDAHWAREDGDDERADDLEADAEWARMDAEDDELDEEAAECTRCFGLKHHPSDSSKPCPECNGTGECPKLEEDVYTGAEAAKILIEAFGWLIASGIIGAGIGNFFANWATGGSGGYVPSGAKLALKKLRQRLNLTPKDFQAAKLIERAYNQDPEFKALIDKYMKPDGSFKSAGYSKIQDYCRSKGVDDLDHFFDKLRGFRQNNPLEEAPNDELGIGMKPADYKRVGQNYAVKRDTYPVEYMHEVDSPYKHNDITTSHDSRQEALAQIKVEVQAYISAFDDPSVTHERGSTVWQGKIPYDDRYGEGSFDQRWSLHEVPVKKWVESINLDSIVESVLEEFPGQPKDYEVEYDDPDDLGPIARGKSAIMKAHGAKDLPMSDYENDSIDPEIEDEELGLRFD